MKIAIIGTGNLWSSIAKGVVKNKSFASLEKINQIKKN